MRIKKCEAMSVRAYMLFDIVERNREDALQILRSRIEVILADSLEGYPNIIAMVEAVDRQNLTEVVMPILESLDGIIENLRFLVTRDNGISPALPTSNNRAPYRRGRQNNWY